MAWPRLLPRTAGNASVLGGASSDGPGGRRQLVSSENGCVAREGEDSRERCGGGEEKSSLGSRQTRHS